MFFVFFFFSSRRRHTRWPRDWSSDVCSSDLASCTPARYGRRSSRGGYPPVGSAARTRPSPLQAPGSPARCSDAQGACGRSRPHTQPHAALGGRRPRRSVSRLLAVAVLLLALGQELRVGQRQAWVLEHLPRQRVSDPRWRHRASWPGGGPGRGGIWRLPTPRPDFGPAGTAAAARTAAAAPAPRSPSAPPAATPPAA